MRLRGSERSGAFGGRDPEPSEVPKRLSEEVELPLSMPVDFLPGGSEGGVLPAGCLSVR